MRTRTCQSCDGTGVWMIEVSPLRKDGFRMDLCGICHGTGIHWYLAPPSWRRSQQQCRAMVQRWRGLKPPQTGASR